MPSTWHFSLTSLAALCLLAIFNSACFPREPGPRLSHFPDRSPAPGEPAPRFEVTDLEGRILSLDELRDGRPLVLLFGSRSCPVFRYRRFALRRIHRDLGEQVQFVVVYTLEAHPVGAPSPYTEDEWDLWINRITGVRIPVHESMEERRERAREARERLELTMPVYVDGPQDRAWELYGAAPSPVFVLDVDRRVVLRQVWAQPRELRRVLEELVASATP